MSRNILADWWELKQKIKKFEKEEQSIRQKILDAMKAKNQTEAQSGEYQVIRRTSTRQSLSKKNCPAAVWNQYATTSTFETLRLINVRDTDEFEEV